MDNKIDRFFKESLRDFQAEASDNLWERLEEKMPAAHEQNIHFSSGKSFYKYLFSKQSALYISAAAAATALLIVAGLLFFENSHEEHNSNLFTSYDTFGKKNITDFNTDKGYDIYNFTFSRGVNNTILLNNRSIFIQNDNGRFLLKDSESGNLNSGRLYERENKTVITAGKNQNQKISNDIINVAGNYYPVNSDNIERQNNFDNSGSSAIAGSQGGAVNSINQASMQQNNIYAGATNVLIKDTVKYITADLSRDEASFSVKENNSKSKIKTEMFEAFGIDTSNRKEIQELHLADNIPSQVLVFPNVFTPNNDGANDYFTILGIDNCTSNSLLITDRNGRAIYETTNYQNDWDARNNPEGVYYFIFKCKVSGNEMVKKGIVTILR